MATADEPWTDEGIGAPPSTVWSYSTESKLTHLAVAWESEETVAADDAGGLSLIGPEGRLIQVTRGLADITAVAIAATGEYVAVSYGQKVALLNRALAVVWSLSLYDRVTSLAIDPFGRHVAIALNNRDVRIYTISRRRIGEFEVVRPLKYLQFSATEPRLIGAAEDGLLASYGVDGTLQWDMRLFATCGDMAASGDGKTILLAGFAHGVQKYDGSGTSRGAFVVEGTPARISTCFDGSRIAASTLERQVFLLDKAGNLKWAATADHDIAALRCDATGRGLTLGFAEGRIEKLGWG